MTGMLTTLGRSRLGTAGAAATLLAGFAGPARAQGPMYYLETFGQPGHELARITWALLILSILVVVIIAVLVAVGVARRAVLSRSLPVD